MAGGKGAVGSVQAAGGKSVGQTSKAQDKGPQKSADTLPRPATDGPKNSAAPVASGGRSSGIPASGGPRDVPGRQSVATAPQGRSEPTPTPTPPTGGNPRTAGAPEGGGKGNAPAPYLSREYISRRDADVLGATGPAADKALSERAANPRAPYTPEQSAALGAAGAASSNASKGIDNAILSGASFDQIRSGVDGNTDGGRRYLDRINAKQEARAAGSSGPIGVNTDTARLDGTDTPQSQTKANLQLLVPHKDPSAAGGMNRTNEAIAQADINAELAQHPGDDRPLVDAMRARVAPGGASVDRYTSPEAVSTWLSLLPQNPQTS